MNNILFSKKDAVKIKIIPVEQPIGIFYIGIALATEVIEICSAKERTKSEQDDLEKYIGMQRPLNADRVEEIKKYVKTWDASFPNSIILAVNPDCYFFENDFIYIKRSKESANIIDGQHRLAGFTNKYEGEFEIILSLFPELEMEEQAYLFSVINTRMTRINPSLAQDLLEFSTINTPEKLAHNIAKTFNEDDSSPWYGKIKMLGRKEVGQIDPVLSQSTFTREIMNLICDRANTYTIRDELKKSGNNREVLKDFYDEKTKNRFILWEPFVDNADKFIFTVLKDFFSSVKELYSEDWEDKSKILTKTTGYTALMRVFDKLVRKGLQEKNLTKNYFLSRFKQAKESGRVRDFTSDNYNPGSMGERNLTRDFINGMGLNE